jgi:thioredoxin-like negative regulator of GroEL
MATIYTHTDAESRLPTFMVFKQGKPVEKVQGADVQKLQRVVRDLANMATDASGPSNSGSGSSNYQRDMEMLRIRLRLKGLSF